MHPSVAFRTDDTENWGLPLAGPGLLLDVPGAGRWSGRSSLHVEFTSRFRLRVSSGGQPLFWVRIDDWWHGCGLLRGTISTPLGLPPLSAARVRDVPHEPGSSRWWKAWTWHMARDLAQATHPVLHTGRWCLRPLRLVTAR